jgi:hypothetical protein
MASGVENKRVALTRPSPAKAFIPRTAPKGYNNILKFFHDNVVEVKFVRRGKIPKNPKLRGDGHRKKTRRMLCTANWRFVRSPVVKKYFKWTKPKKRKGRQYYQKKNLLIVWDLIQQDFRIINLDRWRIAAYVPTTTLLEKGQFAIWYRFNIYGSKMTDQARKRFSDT